MAMKPRDTVTACIMWRLAAAARLMMMPQEVWGGSATLLRGTRTTAPSVTTRLAYLQAEPTMHNEG